MKRRKRPDRAPYASGMFDELVCDSFAGGGGASLGIEKALGRAVDVAVNHNREAVALHTANHPHTRHYCEDVWTVDPLEVTGGKPVGLAWFSPDCAHFSRAKGGKPVSKKIRGLAWVVVKWAKLVKPRVIMLENVREFATWGPLVPAFSKGGIALVDKDGRQKYVPCPIRKGETFRRWVGQLRRLGYTVEFRSLDAADYGAPTHRKRLFLIARRDGQPIVWPEPTHGPGRARPYRTAAECIDWSLPCPSIFLDRAEGRKAGVNRPLAEKTMKRIAMGLKRYVFDDPRPFIVRVDHGGDEFRGQPILKPLSTVTQKHGFGLVSPFLTAQYGERPGQPPRSHRADRPIPTVTPRAGGGFPLIEASLRPSDARVASLEAPLGTVTSVARPGLVAPILTRLCQNGGNGLYANRVEDPLTTIVSKAEHCLAVANLVQFNQEKGDEVRGKPLSDPLNTVVSANRHALAMAFLAKHYTGVVGSGLADPIGTVTAVDHHSLVAANLIKMNFGDKQWSAVDEPLRTVLAGANHHALVTAFLTKYYGKSTGQSPADPLHTVTSVDRLGLVMVLGQPYMLDDVGLRMLTPRELYRAQGFPDSYRIEIAVAGRRLPKSAQVRMCGNSVSPVMSEALVRANLVEAEILAEARA